LKHFKLFVSVVTRLKFLQDVFVDELIQHGKFLLVSVNRFERFFFCYLFNFRSIQFLLLCLILIVITAASTASAFAATSSTAFTCFVLLSVHHLVLICEVVLKIDSLFVLKNLTLFFYDFLALMTVFIFVVSRTEAQQCCGVYGGVLSASDRVHYIYVGFEFIFCLEGHVAF